MSARGLFASLIAVTAGCTAAGGDADEAGAFRVDRIEAAVDGTPYFVSGELGRVAAPGAARLASAEDAAAAVAGALPAIASTLHVPAADLVARRVDQDRIGMTHVRMEQRKHGLRVVGGDVVLHMTADGAIRSVTSTARDGEVDATPAIAADAAAGLAVASTGGAVEARGSELLYEISTGDGELYLAWQVEVVGTGGLLLDDLVYVDAHGGRVVDRRPQVFTARSREVYDGQGKTLQNITSPPLLGTEASPPMGEIPLAAFTNTGATYDCYQTLFQRDSYDDKGSKLVSIVHALFSGPGGATPDNAAWVPTTNGGGAMVYGDGDGNLMGPTALGFDVTAHELTHGVTSATANLAYQNESGALNEAMSDIMGAVCEAWRDKAISGDTWKVGEDIWTPTMPDDALRYMNDPAKDGSSRDYYPDRYTGTQDNGGVHFNSGIGNLGFYLLTAGGTHPRSKTKLAVPALGIEKAGAIFERALTKGYFTANTDFAMARTATEQVAQELYPGCTKTAVSMAWAAVGVGTAPPMISDAVPPTTAIAAPADGATVPAGFQVQVDASDDQCILKIEVSIDGKLVATGSASPFAFTTDPALAPGPHTIDVATYDLANKATATATVMIAAACTSDSQCGDGESCDAGACLPGDGSSSGCGCSTGGRRGAAGALAMALAMAFALRRRRAR
jgi:MYXO-CTERM domain-containing protein